MLPIAPLPVWLQFSTIYIWLVLHLQNRLSSPGIDDLLKIKTEYLLGILDTSKNPIDSILEFQGKKLEAVLGSVPRLPLLGIMGQWNSRIILATGLLVAH